jgi:hypothetical protein
MLKCSFLFVNQKNSKAQSQNQAVIHYSKYYIYIPEGLYVWHGGTPEDGHLWPKYVMLRVKQ